MKVIRKDNFSISLTHIMRHLFFHEKKSEEHRKDQNQVERIFYTIKDTK